MDTNQFDSLEEQVGELRLRVHRLEDALSRQGILSSDFLRRPPEEQASAPPIAQRDAAAAPIAQGDAAEAPIAAPPQSNLSNRLAALKAAPLPPPKPQANPPAEESGGNGA